VQALGGTAHRCRPQLGFAEVLASPAAQRDPLLGAAPPRLAAFHAHTFAFSPPADAEVLLVDDVCVQACRQGRAWAFQCHPEVPAEWVRALAAGLRHRDGDLLAATTAFFADHGVSAERLERDAASAESAMAATAALVASGFAAQLA
ncbi:MAG: hypothetical protein ACRDL5_07635, partial [Solirubrobacteraceae bacterium]